MPQTRQYKVTLMPAEKGAGRDFSFQVHDPAAKTYPVSAGSLADLATAVRRLVTQDFRRPCAVFVRVDDGGRKPPRFDAAARELQFIDFQGASA